MVNRFVVMAFLIVLGAAFEAAAQPSEADRQLFKQTKAKADKGDRQAQLQMGNFYFTGTGVSKDPEKGAKWHRKAAEQGLAAAQYQLALDYTLGEGVKSDKTQAAAWFRRAAEQGMAEAQIELGLCCLRGDGVRANAAEALEWFRKAAAQGAVDAEFQIGQCYMEGAGVPRDIERGLKWISHAAERGFPPAQARLAECYEKGIGVAKDPQQAYKWFALAAARDDARALEHKVGLAKVESLLSKEQVAEAQRLARDFKPANLPLPDDELNGPPGEGVLPAGERRDGAASAQAAEQGFVTVNGGDERCEIYADGHFFGNSPAKLKLGTGTHMIEVRRSGYKPYRREIHVTAGSDLNLRVEQEKE